MSTTRVKANPRKSPVLAVTSYDRASAIMIALVVGLVSAVICLGVIWFTNRIPTQEPYVPLELLELAGGEEDGVPDETLNVESPEPETADPSVAEVQDEQVEISEMLETVVELSDQAAEQVQQQFETQAQNTGNPGSKKGTGGRPLGMGPGEGGMPREQRWFIRFADRGTLTEYAKQLSFFGIELGALMNDGKLYYLTKLTAAKPNLRSVNSGKGEQRLYMTWRGGNRRKSDLALFKKGGLNATAGMVMHFYPPKIEAELAGLEKKYRNRPVEQIRRTYFVVRSAGSGYRFVVTKQSYLR